MTGERPDLPRRRAAVAVAFAAFVVYVASPVRQLSDSHYSLLLSERFATRGTLDLAPDFAGELPLDRFPGARHDGLPYQVKRYGERVLYEFPIGAPLLAAPWMAVAHALHLGVTGVVGADSSYDLSRERRHQKLLAALFTAIFVGGAFVALDRLTSRRAAWLVAAALALATPAWSTASRGLWSHTAELALLGLALPIVAARRRGDQNGGLRLGLLAAGAYVCRPTASIALALLAIDLAWSDRGRRRAALRFAAGAGVVLAAFAALSWRTWGTLVPPYYASSRLALPSLTGLAGALFSPSRGLLVFEPELVVALLFGALRFRVLAERRLFLLGSAGLALNALVVASFPRWWGGHGYGPRLLTGTLFFQALIAASVAATLLRSGSQGWRRALAASIALGAVIHGAGALSNEGNRWNWSPNEIDRHPERLWEWEDPQFLAWATGPRPPKAPPAIEPAATPP